MRKKSREMKGTQKQELFIHVKKNRQMNEVYLDFKNSSPFNFRSWRIVESLWCQEMTFLNIFREFQCFFNGI